MNATDTTIDEQWYEVRTYCGLQINPVTVVRETEQSVFIETEWFGKVKTSRRLKVSQGETYIKGFAAAKAHALEAARRKLEFARTALREAEKTVETVAAMHPPALRENGETR